MQNEKWDEKGHLEGDSGVLNLLQAPFPEEDEEVHHSVPRFFTTFSEDIGDGI